MNENKGELVLPGQRLGVIEELLPGEGVYVDADGMLRSARLGYLAKENGRVSVKPIREPLLPLKPGTKVVGVVWGSERALFHVKIFGVVKPKAKLERPVSGIIPKSHPANLGVRPGDFILAKVWRVDSEQVVLTLAGPSLGVIWAKCPSCRSPLKRVGYTLVCDACGKVILDRRVSDLYGQNPLEGTV